MTTTGTTGDAALGASAPSIALSARSSTRTITREQAARYVWAISRLGMGWIFLWPFLDKTFGLGHETPSASSWINGGNPTEGFLSHSIGPFSGIYQNIAGETWVNVLFIFGLLGIGVALLLGVVMRIACAGGAALVLLMWSASLPPANDVFMDDHVIFAFLLVGLALVGAGSTLGLGKWWARTNIVQRFPWLA